MDLKAYLKSRQEQVDRALDEMLPAENCRPATIHRAMRYSLFAGGKRLRPVLCLAAAEVCEGTIREAMPLACAVECVHTYSLVHDDLPCMDNDDFRRGKPTCHKVFGDGIAVLAGDALLTVAFELAAQCRSWPRYSHANVVSELAQAAGSRFLIAGQVVDLESEGKEITASQLQYIHECKTAALLRAALRLGAMSANATPRKLAAVSEFGHALGLAFQIIDDILDVTQTTEQLGKSAGKDVDAQKATYPKVLGMKGAERAADRWTKRAREALKPLGRKADLLHQFADFLLRRQS